MDDNSIIGLFFARSENAISQLIKKYGKAMHNISFNILKNQQDAEECVNDACLGVWNTIPPENPNPLVTFVLKITRNISLAKYRKNRAQKRNTLGQVRLEEISDCIPDSQRVEDEIDVKELCLELNNWLSTLNNDSLYIFMRHYWYMDGSGKIAEQMGISENAVNLRILRLKNKLYRHLLNKGFVSGKE